MYEPITLDEARGDSQPMRKACLDKLAARGAALIERAAYGVRPSDRLCGSEIDQAWKATRERWGGRTVDLRTGQSVRRPDGYAVSTGSGEGGHHSHLPATAGYLEFYLAMLDASRQVPPGQHLGVFHDAWLHRIDFDSVYVTDNRDDAIAVAVASHSLAGAYDFATGGAVWTPYLNESDYYATHNRAGDPYPESE